MQVKAIEGRWLMAHSYVAVALATVFALVRSASAQTPCLDSVTYLLPEYCPSYLSDITVTSPDPGCCSVVTSVSTNYGSDCLCQVILYYQANPDLNPLIIPGRLYTLPAACNAHANMSNCAAPPSAPPSPPLPANAPPAPVTAPTSSVSTPPEVETPTLGVPSALTPPSSGSKVSTGAVVGGSVGGVSVLGIVVYILVKCLQSSKFEVKWDVNSPCWCCHRREKPHSSYGGTERVPYPAPHPAPHSAPYPAPHPAPYPVHYGAYA